MEKTTYINANIFCDGEFRYGSFAVSKGRFEDVLNEGPIEGRTVDLDGAFVIPGLIDIHTHGNSGEDFSDGSYEGIEKMAGYLAREGITSFAPASMTLPYETLEKAYRAGREFHEKMPEGHSRLMGINMEGPFFSMKRKGAQNGAYLKDPDIEAFKRLFEISGGLIRIVDIAAELNGAEAFAKEASGMCTVSIAHSDAGYEDAKKVIEAGATHITHLFNAMPGIHHRNPGIIGAASENENVTAELICDGYHVHESAVRMALKLFPGRICIISDSLRCCGMPDGEYELGGQTVYLKGSLARLEDGTIAGSATNLYACMLNAVRFGMSREEAVRAVTEIPAREIGRSDEIGSVKDGLYADFVVCDKDLTKKKVFIGGKEI